MKSKILIKKTDGWADLGMKRPETETPKPSTPDPLAAQVKANSESIESILALLRFVGPGLVGLSPDPAGVDLRLSQLKGAGGHRAGELNAEVRSLIG